METNPDPMQIIMAAAGMHPVILNLLGRFAGMLYGIETNDFHDALTRVSTEMQGTFWNIANTTQNLRNPQLSREC